MWLPGAEPKPREEAHDDANGAAASVVSVAALSPGALGSVAGRLCERGAGRTEMRGRWSEREGRNALLGL